MKKKQNQNKTNLDTLVSFKDCLCEGPHESGEG